MTTDPERDQAAYALSLIDPSLRTPALVAEVGRATYVALQRREAQERIRSLTVAADAASRVGSWTSVPSIGLRLGEEERWLDQLSAAEIDADIGAEALELAAGKIGEVTELASVPLPLAYTLERQAWESLPEELFPLVHPVVTRPVDIALEEKLAARQGILEAIEGAIAQWQDVRLAGGGAALPLLASASSIIDMLRDLQESSSPLRDEVEIANRNRLDAGFEWVAPPDIETPETRRLTEFRAFPVKAGVG